MMLVRRSALAGPPFECDRLLLRPRQRGDIGQVDERQRNRSTREHELFETLEEAVRDFVSEVASVAAVEEVPDRRVGAAGGGGDRGQGDVPYLLGSGVVTDGAKEAPVGVPGGGDRVVNGATPFKRVIAYRL